MMFVFNFKVLSEPTDRDRSRRATFFLRSFFTHHNNKTRGQMTAEFIEVLYCFAATGRRMRPPMASADGGFYCASADTLFGGVSRSVFAL